MIREHFTLLGIESVPDLSRQDADDLYCRIAGIIGARPDPCVHDTYAAAIHQAKTGEPLYWWNFTPERKRRQAAGSFPLVGG